jgi:mono/diheme cytochrome c family protein
MRGLLIALVLCTACGKNEQPPPPLGDPPAVQETGPAKKKPKYAGDPSPAERLFSSLCATCHGIDGTGNGPGAASLNPKPRNYTDPAWQASVTDDDIKNIIVKGGQAVGKSAMMPPSPQLEGDAATLDGLVKIIRAFGKQGETPK